MTPIIRILQLACNLFVFPIVGCQQACYHAELRLKFFGKHSSNSYQTIFSAVGATFGESINSCSKFCSKDQRCIGIETCQIREDLFQCRVCCEWKETGNNIDKQPGCKYLEMVNENGQNRVGCHVGWIQFRNKCYWFSQDAKPWVEVKGICALNHTKLAEPRTASESSFLISHSQRIGGIYWIGISDMIEEGRWIYSSDQKVIQVNDFQPGQPNQYTASNCVALWQNFHGKWADEPCGRNYRFICETEIE